MDEIVNVLSVRSVDLYVYTIVYFVVSRQVTVTKQVTVIILK
jgi:hypothetical protein